jgi:hypothetical protein
VTPAAILPARRSADGPSPGPAMVVNLASPSRRPITTRGTTSDPGASRTNGSAPRATVPVPRAGHVVAALDGGQGAGHLGHRSAIGETAGKLDAQGNAAPGQPEALVLPQDAVAASSCQEADVRGVDAGSQAGQAGRRGCEAARSRRQRLPQRPGVCESMMSAACRSALATLSRSLTF